MLLLLPNVVENEGLGVQAVKELRHTCEGGMIAEAFLQQVHNPDQEFESMAALEQEMRDKRKGGISSGAFVDFFLECARCTGFGAAEVAAVKQLAERSAVEMTSLDKEVEGLQSMFPMPRAKAVLAMPIDHRVTVLTHMKPIDRLLMLAILPTEDQIQTGSQLPPEDRLVTLTTAADLLSQLVGEVAALKSEVPHTRARHKHGRLHECFGHSEGDVLENGIPGALENRSEGCEDFAENHRSQLIRCNVNLAEELLPTPPCLHQQGIGQSQVEPLFWGLSIAQWFDFVDACVCTPLWAALAHGTGEWSIDMYKLNDYFITPWTRGTGSSIALTMNPNPVQVEMMVSHAWAGSVVETYIAFKELLHSGRATPNTKLFFCTMSMYQPQDGASGGLSIQEQLALDPFGKVIASNPILGMKVVHTVLAQVYSRLWTVYEVNAALDAGVLVEAIGLAYFMPDTMVEEAASWEEDHTGWHPEEKEVELTDCRQAQCTESDRSMLVCKIEESGGFDRLNSQIYEFRMRVAKEAQKKIKEVGRTGGAAVDLAGDEIPDGLNSQTSLLHDFGFPQQWPRATETCSFCCDMEASSGAQLRNRNPATWKECGFRTSVCTVYCPYCGAWISQYIMCFEASGKVALTNGGSCSVADLKPGAIVQTPNGTSQVRCVVRTQCHAPTMTLVQLSSGPLLTASHPVLWNGTWKRADQVGQHVEQHCSVLYNFVLSSEHILIVNGYPCLTLGHNFKGPGAYHPFYGTVAVIAYLQRHPSWSTGFVDLEQGQCSCSGNGQPGQQLDWLITRLQQGQIMDPELLLNIRAATLMVAPVMHGFRLQPITLRSEHHVPPDFGRIEGLVTHFCRETSNLIQGNADPFFTAAFCLWWVNSVHPFDEANGRTARVLCFALLGHQSKGQHSAVLLTPEMHSLFHIEELRAEYLLSLQQANQNIGFCQCCNDGTIKPPNQMALSRLIRVVRKAFTTLVSGTTDLCTPPRGLSVS